jgi:hypothetical protein
MWKFRGLDKFEDLNERFESLGTRMTHTNKFEDLNGRFASLGIGMTQTNKFEDHQWTLLFLNKLGFGLKLNSHISLS